jgi:hypothetical protein
MVEGNCDMHILLIMSDARPPSSITCNHVIEWQFDSNTSKLYYKREIDFLARRVSPGDDRILCDDQL